MDLRDLARKAEAFQAADQIVDRVAVLAEDEPFLAVVARLLEHFAQLLEFRFPAFGEKPPRPPTQLFEGRDLLLQFFGGDGDRGAEDRILVSLALLAVIVVGAPRVEEVAPAVEVSLQPLQLGRARLAGTQSVDAAFQLPDPALEGTQQRPGRTGEPALEDAHRQLHRRALLEGAVVDAAQPGGGEVVERLFALRAGGEVVAEGVAQAPPIERAAVQTDHLFLGAAEEMAAPRRPREGVERLRGREDLRVQQPPEMVIGRSLAHMRRRGKQQQMPRRPAEAGEARRGRGAAGKGLRQFVAPRLAGAVIMHRGAELVRFVEDDEVVWGHGGVPQGAERLLAGQGVQGHDDEIAVRPPERVARLQVGPGNDAEAQAEQGAELPFPIADEAGGRDDQYPPQMAAGHRLAYVEAGHDGLAGAGVVGQQEAQRLARKHALIDGDALMGQRVDACRLAGEGGVELMAVGQPQSLRDRGDRLWVAREIERRGRVRGRGGAVSGQQRFELPQTFPRQALRA